jgi:hypothetical protein
MKIRKIIAYKIYEIRNELDIDGSQEHDWWLADQFLQKIGVDRFDDDDLYNWFVQLDENLVEKQTK